MKIASVRFLLTSGLRRFVLYFANLTLALIHCCFTTFPTKVHHLVLYIYNNDMCFDKMKQCVNEIQLKLGFKSHYKLVSTWCKRQVVLTSELRTERISVEITLSFYHAWHHRVAQLVSPTMQITHANLTKQHH